eukprot:510008-Alexandrium_andersonii.AAC.1
MQFRAGAELPQTNVLYASRSNRVRGPANQSLLGPLSIPCAKGPQRRDNSASGCLNQFQAA